VPKPQLKTLTADDGTAFRDLDHDQRMAPFEDPRRTPADRADDLVSRLSLAEKVVTCHGWRKTYVESTETAAGVIPGMRDAWPSVSGRT